MEQEAEDIAARLRQLAWPGTQWTPETLAMVRAADEIDRLWALLGQREKEIDRLQDQLIDFYKALEYSVKQN